MENLSKSYTFSHLPDECILSIREENKNRGAYKDTTVSRLTIMNQYGPLLTRKNIKLEVVRNKKYHP